MNFSIFIYKNNVNNINDFFFLQNSGNFNVFLSVYFAYYNKKNIIFRKLYEQ